VICWFLNVENVLLGREYVIGWMLIDVYVIKLAVYLLRMRDWFSSGKFLF
jgi:hypothetical protein